MNLIPRRRPSDAPSTWSDLEDFWQRFFGDGGTSRLPEFLRGRNVPPLNVSETEDAYRVTLDAPGMEEKDFDIQVMGDQLLISGERKWEEEQKGREFHRVETQYGAFQRSVRLPSNLRLDADAIRAEYENGVLSIHIPKVEKTPARKIEVRKG